MSTSSVRHRIAFDPDTAEFYADPYPTYHRIRAEGPVAWSEKHQFWFLSRHADVTAAFNHPSLGHGTKRTAPGEGAVESDAYRPLTEAAARWVLFKDPPSHGIMRRLIQQAFATISYQALIEQIGVFADGLLDDMIQRGQTELIDDFAFPLPLLSIMTLLGVPEEDRPLVFEWARQIWRVFDLTTTEDSLRRGSEWVSVVQDYFQRLAVERRASPRRDLLSAMLSARDGEARMDEEDVVANCVLMLFAGHDTTAHLLGNGTLVLLQNPGHLDRMRRDSTLDDTVVSELLRYISPQQLALRNALADFEIAGVQVKSGDKVCLGVGAANRDPEVFADPDTLSFDRPRLNHLAFASGIHSCPGSRLARLTARIGFRKLVSRLNEIRLREYAWERAALIRGLEFLRLDVA